MAEQTGKVSSGWMCGGPQISVQSKTFVLISLPCLCLNKGSTLTGQGSRGAGGLS